MPLPRCGKHKLSGDGITGRVLSIIKSFLIGRSLKVVFNHQSSKVNTGDSQGPRLGPKKEVISAYAKL